MHVELRCWQGLHVPPSSHCWASRTPTGRCGACTPVVCAMGLSTLPYPHVLTSSCPAAGVVARRGPAHQPPCNQSQPTTPPLQADVVSRQLEVERAEKELAARAAAQRRAQSALADAEGAVQELEAARAERVRGPSVESPLGTLSEHARAHVVCGLVGKGGQLNPSPGDATFQLGREGRQDSVCCWPWTPSPPAHAAVSSQQLEQRPSLQIPSTSNDTLSHGPLTLLCSDCFDAYPCLHLPHLHSCPACLHAAGAPGAAARPTLPPYTCHPCLLTYTPLPP